jgi:hypothetical protein
MTSLSSERTPLLRSVSPNPQNGSAVAENEITAAEVAQQGEGGAPQFPGTGKNPPDDDLASTQATENLVKFQENGKLEGVGVWKFRCVFGGILLGYFVSHLEGPSPGAVRSRDGEPNYSNGALMPTGQKSRTCCGL